jgi:hypothetical protein
MPVGGVVPLDPDFPCVSLAPSSGHWWRVHGAEYGPWWFASSDRAGRAANEIGRFDLPQPWGTCYVGSYLAAVTAEAMRVSGVDAKAAQEAASRRRLSQMPLDHWHGKKIADFTAVAVEQFGAPADIGALDRSEARPWAMAALNGGFHGMLFSLHEDPERREGLALLGCAGLGHPPDNQPPPVRLPVGLGHEVQELFDGEFRGDALAS